MKKIICFLLSLFLVSSLFGCSGKEKYTIEINGEGFPKGVYTYYLDKVMRSPDEYSIKNDDKDKIQAKALELCKQCTATDNYMKKNSITLDLYLKSDAAQKTESLWSMFSAHYKSLGIAKTDITRINTYEAQKQKLLQLFYGEGGKEEVSQDDLKQKFVELYVGFKGFEVPLTKTNAKGEVVDMIASEKKEVENNLRKIVDKINDGQSIDAANRSYMSSQGLVVTDELELILTKRNDPMYDDGFFDKVASLSHGKTAIVKSGKSIYVVQRERIASDDNDAFEQYKTEILETMKMPSLEKTITNWATKLEATVNEKETNMIYNSLLSDEKQKKGHSTQPVKQHF